MGTDWLANAHPETFWPHFSWGWFAALSDDTRARTLVVLPVHGFADHGLGLPLDAEEAAGGAVLRRASGRAWAAGAALCVLPPLRFALAPYPCARFGVNAETARAHMLEIAKSVRAAGFSQMVFFNTSPWNEELAAVAALDARVEFGLRNHVVNLSRLGMSFHPGAPREARANAQAAAMRALGLPAGTVRANIANAPMAAVSDTGFRPGNFQQPETLAPDESLDGGAILEMVSARAGMALRAAAGDFGEGAPPAAAGLADGAAFPPSCRGHCLAALTASELAALPGKEGALVIIPAGAIEQHGPHLPVGVDAILGQALLANALPKLAPGAARRVFVAPPVTYGRSNEHEGFPGTISISAGTLRGVLLAMAAELRAAGFRCIAILNTHGGNSPVVVQALREMQALPGMCAGMLASRPGPDAGGMTPREAAFGFHAGQWETALMLACAPELVRMDKAVCEYPAALEKLGPTGAALAWMTRDISTSGVMGDARAATPGLGRAWLEKAGDALAARIAGLL